MLRAPKVLSVETEDKVLRLSIRYNPLKLGVVVSLVLSSVPCKELGKVLLVLALVLSLLGVNKYDLVDGFRLRIGAFDIEVRVLDK